MPMKELKGALENAGFKEVNTYIQSGNITLKGTSCSGDKVAALINDHFGFMPKVLVLTVDEFNQAIVNNPYQEFEGKYVHFYFCKKTPKLNSEKSETLSSVNEHHQLIGNVFYLHAPEGIGRSRLVAGIESCLGVCATGRNLNTINKLREMVINGH